MISIKEQQGLFIEISKRLSKKIIVYAIGGTAMMFLGFKESTIDIDLVFTSREDRKAFKEAAKSLGYKEMDSTIVYGVANNCPEMIRLDDSRLDLFFLNVIDYEFSKKMQERAAQLHQFGDNLFLRVADIHDIILMKCATKRAKDEDDIVRIVQKSKINWDILVEEAKNQVSLGREIAILCLGTLLEKLKDTYKLDVPKAVIDALWKALKVQVDEKAKARKQRKH